MGAKNKTKYSDIKIGDRYGDWLVVGDVFVDRYAKVPCKCICGKQKNVDAYTLTIGKSKKCKTCGLPQATNNNPAWKGYEEIPASWFTRFRNYAKIKGNEFDLNLEDVWKLYLKQNRKCALTGLPIDFKGSNEKHTTKYTASIDRVDSKEGYTINNIQLVHKDVNIMKNAFNQDYFVQLCNLVSNHNGT